MAGGADVFSTDVEVGKDLAAVDWAAHPLGPPTLWPQSLRTAVSILLSSRFSMWMAWGPDLTFFCNSAYRRDTLGSKYPWALGRPANEVWAEIWDDIGPRVDTVLRTGDATWDQALLLFVQRSGYPEESYHTFSYSPLRDDTGSVVGMLCVVSEDTERVISERRMATLRELGSDPSVVRTEEEILAFSGRQLSRNQADLPFALTYLYDDDGSARLANAAGIAAGHPAAPARLSADGAHGVWPVAALSQGDSTVVSLDARPFAGLPTGAWAEAPTHALVVPLLQQGDAPYGFLVAALNQHRPLDDIYRGFVELVAGHIAAGIASARSYRAQQQRAEELAELDRAKTAFFSNISHEFRTPLTLIMGPLEELRGRLGREEPEVRQELDTMHRNGLRLGKLVNTLLDFSRIEAGRMQATYEPADLSVVTSELASVFRSAIDRAGLGFTVDCPPLDEPVYIDRSMWEKVVLNLLSNALKFTFDGSIAVTVRAASGWALVTVKDTGIGVPVQEMPRLFERFHRIENVRSRSNEGSGIGLALVKELVGLHGGTITADSAEGEGTSFAIRLPFGTAHLPADAVTPPAANVASSSAAAPYVQEAMRWLPTEQRVDALADVGHVTGPDFHAQVLIADDNADMREYLSRLLAAAGYEVRAVADGLAALNAIRTQSPDLVVSDVMMPRLDGLSLVTALRTEPRTAAVPVLLLSARAGQEASIEGLQAGADDYLVKPFAAAELLARVRANVELARMRNHHARWRTALVDSLQEAFFVCNEDGAVIEINSAFTDILGYGPEDLPYTPTHPWWPDADTDPEAHQQVADAFAGLLDQSQGSHTIPVTHRDGRRLWISATFNPAQDPDSGRTVTVGTFRDATADHYAIQRDGALASLSTSLAQAEDLAEALSTALGELKEVWQASSVLAAVFDRGDTPTLNTTDPSLTWQHLSANRRQTLTALRGRTLLTPTVDSTGAGITLEHPDGPMALWIDLGHDRPFTSEDELLLSLLAGHLAQGLTRAHQIDQQREIALVLQRAILGPSQLPEGFAVRYEPATRPLEVGGDWYDTVSLPDGRIGIVVGDCVGRGLGAATVMGQLSSACRALLLQNGSPARALMALDHFAAGVPGALCTTVFCGVLDPKTGHLTYSSAGHPPGILAHPDGTTSLLDGGRYVPLAVRPGAARPEAECNVPARATLLLYTDGLVERRRRPLTTGIDQAGEAVQAGRESAVDDLATQVMERLAPAGGYDDDVALLLYRHPAPLEVTFPAESQQLAPVRKALRTWLGQCDLPPHTVQNVLVAAGEACANAIEHGHRHSPGETIRLRAEALVDDLYLSVIDSGNWKPPQPELNTHRGRGVTLMRALMQQVTITPSPDGTTVGMHTRIA
ncbi:PAS domain S-box-containing protein [Streptomyces sp. MnatMP-M77]|uniref:SpoIIE family protein phosphatase n=1 Tax=unclassified Streptomyces TaxID=2593676 RepID=UPI000804F24E|nr:SpoIIE family protein phosphatase [Streptomyces sp. MnatMP-M77]MYT82446.1 SpoIIE family protein phosphatase [Streptomyces sp. SID8364]SBU96675.1 PAS domain S-box-containing protein [Streptomyces sp. MnatMP-M77]